MKKEEFIVGQWYKNLDDGWIGKFQKLLGLEWWGSEWITEDQKFDDCSGWIRTKDNTCLCPLSEIYEYLPDGHPDKIKPINDLEPLLKLLKQIE